MDACTSRAAASIFRLRSNCIVMLVEPRLLAEVISVIDAMRPNCRSSGVATEDAMVSGLAPGNCADTEMVGKSTWGSGDTGKTRKATQPASAMAMVSSVVATGLRMKSPEMFMASLCRCRLRTGSDFALLLAGESSRQPIEPKVNDRRGVKRQRLAEDKTA